MTKNYHFQIIASLNDLNMLTVQLTVITGGTHMSFFFLLSLSFFGIFTNSFCAWEGTRSNSGDAPAGETPLLRCGRQLLAARRGVLRVGVVLVATEGRLSLPRNQDHRRGEPLLPEASLSGLAASRLSSSSPTRSAASRPPPRRSSLRSPLISASRRWCLAPSPARLGARDGPCPCD